MGISMGISRLLRYRPNGEVKGQPPTTRSFGRVRTVLAPLIWKGMNAISPTEFDLDPYSARIAHAYELVGPAVASINALDKDGRPIGQRSLKRESKNPPPVYSQRR